MSGNGLTGTLTYKKPAASVMNELTEKVFQFKLVADVVFKSSGCGGGCTYTGDGELPRKISEAFTVTWKKETDVCLYDVFVPPTSPVNIAYQEGSTALAIDAFDFTVNNSVLGTTGESAATANARCTYTHTTYYRTLDTDDWSLDLPIPNYVATSPARDATTLAFSVYATVGQFILPGENKACRYVRRVHTNSLTMESIEEVFQICFVQSLGAYNFCKDKTAAFGTRATIPDVIVIQSATISAELDTTNLSLT